VRIWRAMTDAGARAAAVSCELSQGRGWAQDVSNKADFVGLSPRLLSIDLSP
jgi:hypothetical protein